MIKIPIECGENLEEYIMFDMQGQLEHSQESLNCLPLGELDQINEKEYKLIIGIHDIVGTKQLLEPPLIITQTVLEKNQFTQLENQKLLVVGICKWKLIFNKRPTPILERIDKKKIIQLQ